MQFNACEGQESRRAGRRVTAARNGVVQPAAGGGAENRWGSEAGRHRLHRSGPRGRRTATLEVLTEFQGRQRGRGQEKDNDVSNLDRDDGYGSSRYVDTARGYETDGTGTKAIDLLMGDGASDAILRSAPARRRAATKHTSIRLTAEMPDADAMNAACVANVSQFAFEGQNLSRSRVWFYRGYLLSSCEQPESFAGTRPVGPSSGRFKRRSFSGVHCGVRVSVCGGNDLEPEFLLGARSISFAGGYTFFGSNFEREESSPERSSSRALPPVGVQKDC